jgi:hypothetical protein
MFVYLYYNIILNYNNIIMFCAVLYGEIRTLEKCLPSIKRLFRDILNVDFYVIINKSKGVELDYNYYETFIKEQLNPKSYELIDMSQNELCLFQRNKDIYQNKTVYTNKISFEEYSKFSYNKNLYTNEELKMMNAPVEELILKTEDICRYPYNQYIEDYMLNIAFKNVPLEKYTHAFRLRSDVVWFEDYSSQQTNINCLDSYNANINDLNFNSLKQLIYDNIKDNRIIISGLHHIPDFNMHLPCAHAQLMPILLFKDYIEFYNDNNIDKILEQIEKYPILYKDWCGEVQQKKEFQDLKYEINDKLFFYLYSCILRKK